MVSWDRLVSKVIDFLPRRSIAEKYLKIKHNHFREIVRDYTVEKSLKQYYISSWLLLTQVWKASGSSRRTIGQWRWRFLDTMRMQEFSQLGRTFGRHRNRMLPMDGRADFDQPISLYITDGRAKASLQRRLRGMPTLLRTPLFFFTQGQILGILDHRHEARYHFSTTKNNNQF